MWRRVFVIIALVALVAAGLLLAQCSSDCSCYQAPDTITSTSSNLVSVSGCGTTDAGCAGSTPCDSIEIFPPRDGASVCTVTVSFADVSPRDLTIDWGAAEMNGGCCGAGYFYPTAGATIHLDGSNE